MTTTRECESSLLRNFGWNEVEISGGGAPFPPIIAPKLISFQNMAPGNSKIKSEDFILILEVFLLGRM